MMDKVKGKKASRQKIKTNLTNQNQTHSPLKKEPLARIIRPKPIMHLFWPQHHLLTN